MELKLKRINVSNEQELQRVFEGAPLYTLNIDGIDYVPKDSAKSALEALPPSCHIKDKFVFLVMDGDKSIGAIDLIKGYPSEDVAYIGLLLICESLQKKGLGRQVYRLLEEYILNDLKLSKIRLSYVESNPVRLYWEKLGFHIIGNKKPYEGIKNTSFTHIMEKVLRVNEGIGNELSYTVKSLGYRTDFIFNKLDGSIMDKGDYIVAITDSNPNYFWGNLLLFKKPPQVGDLNKWKALFKEEFRNPSIYHMTFAWDSPDAIEGECEEFIEEGFELDKSVVLSTREISIPKKYNGKIKVKEVDLSKELDLCIDIQVDCAHDNLSKDAWRGFYTTTMHNYKNLIDENHGKWFGAYIDDELVGSLGLFTDKEVGRFQIVSTHPDFQRRGVCSTLVYEAAKYALNNMGVTELVMVADEEYHAAKIYESVGFVPTQKQIGLCWWDRERHN